MSTGRNRSILHKRPQLVITKKRRSIASRSMPAQKNPRRQNKPLATGKNTHATHWWIRTLKDLPARAPPRCKHLVLPSVGNRVCHPHDIPGLSLLSGHVFFLSLFSFDDVLFSCFLSKENWALGVFNVSLFIETTLRWLTMNRHRLWMNAFM